MNLKGFRRGIRSCHSRKSKTVSTGGTATQFDCTPDTWDALMHLDAEENQVLTRNGEMPLPADIVAQYNSLHDKA